MEIDFPRQHVEEKATDFYLDYRVQKLIRCVTVLYALALYYVVAIAESFQHQTPSHRSVIRWSLSVSMKADRGTAAYREAPQAQAMRVSVPNVLRMFAVYRWCVQPAR